MQRTDMQNLLASSTLGTVFGMGSQIWTVQPEHTLLPPLLKLADDDTGAAPLTWLEWMVLARNITTAHSQVQQLSLAFHQLHTTFTKQQSQNSKCDAIWTLVRQLKDLAAVVEHSPLMTDVVAKLLEREIAKDLYEFRDEEHIAQFVNSFAQFFKNLNEGKVGPKLCEEVESFGHGKKLPYTMLRALAHLRVASGSKIRRDTQQDDLLLVSVLEKQVIAQITCDDIAKQDWYTANPILVCLQHALQAACRKADWDALEFIMDRLLSFQDTRSPAIFLWTALPTHVLGPYITEFEPSKKTSINKKDNFVVRCEKGNLTILRFVSQMGNAHARMQSEVDGIKKMLKYSLLGAAIVLCAFTTSLKRSDLPWKEMCCSSFGSHSSCSV